MYRVIVVGHEGSIHKEADAAEAITPGHVVDLNGSAKLIKQVAKKKPLAVAVENDLFGGGLDDAYAINDRVNYRLPKPGAEFLGLVGAGAAAIAYGALLKVNTSIAGTLITIGTDEEGLAVARALQAVDNSGGATQARIRVEVL